MELAKRHFQFSYAIERSDDQRIDHRELVNVLRQANLEVQDLVRTGWSMFHVFTRQEIEPVFVTDGESGQGDEDFLECALLRDTKPGFGSPDMWRVSTDGRGTIIRPYWEDGEGLNTSLHRKAGTWFSPNWMVRSLAEFIRHARALSQRFEAPTTVSFRCEWMGLASRQLHDPEALWFDDRNARGGEHGDHRIVSRTWPVSALDPAWPEIVSVLAAPVMRIFVPDFVITADWVRGQAPKWIR